MGLQDSFIGTSEELRERDFPLSLFRHDPSHCIEHHQRGKGISRRRGIDDIPSKGPKVPDLRRTDPGGCLRKDFSNCFTKETKQALNGSLPLRLKSVPSLLFDLPDLFDSRNVNEAPGSQITLSQADDQIRSPGNDLCLTFSLP